MSNLYLSPTGLMDFAGCQATLYYRMKYKIEEEDEDNFGSAAHLIMAEERAATSEDAKEVGAYVRKFREIEESLGIRVLARELRQSWELLPGIMYTRIIDVVGLIDGKPWILDYKTAIMPWKTIATRGGKIISPRAQTLQAPGYMLTPPSDIVTPELWGKLGGVGNWPKQIVFAVAPMRGRAQIFDTDNSPFLESNFMETAKQAKTMYDQYGAAMLHNYGKACDWCNFARACHQSPGWELVFKERTFDEPTAAAKPSPKSAKAVKADTKPRRPRSKA